MLCHFDEMKDAIERLGLSKDDVIIVGSGSITVCGGRLNNDIEFCVKKDAWKRIPCIIRFKLFFVDHYDLTENVDLFRNRYLDIGILDYELFLYQYNINYKGYQVVSPDIEYAYKKKKSRYKDIEDLRKIEKDENLATKFDFKVIGIMEMFRLPLVYRSYLNFRRFSWRQITRLNKLISIIWNGGGVTDDNLMTYTFIFGGVC